jgi:hypothetical protein
MPLQPEAGLNDPQELPAHLLAQPLEQARQRLLQALAAGDSRMRGAALFMQGADAAASLRQLALNGTDPVLVRWALARCPSQEATCRQALTAHAQALEPGNAAAWQEDLTHRGRPSAEVLAHMAAADRHVLHFGHLPALVASAPPADLLPYLRQALVLEAIGLEAAIALPAFQPLVKHCKPGLEAGSGLQQQCEHIARLMVEQGDTLLARGIGLRIAERAGWSAARLSAARAETQALVKASPWPVDEQPMGCAAVSWTLGWAKDLGRAGEVPLLRQRLAAASAPR